MMKNIIEQTESFIRKYGMIEKDDVVIADVMSTTGYGARKPMPMKLL